MYLFCNHVTKESNFVAEFAWKKELQNAFVLVKNMHATHHDRLISPATEFNSLCCSSKTRSDEGLGPETLCFFNLFVF